MRRPAPPLLYLSTKMQYTYRIMSLNINGIESHTRLQMLEEFLQRHDVDIALLHEVTNEKKLVFKLYKSTINIGTLELGTAILSKLNSQLHRIDGLPTGRGLVAYYGNTWIVNIHAPSGTANRYEREVFFITEVIDLLPYVPTEQIMAGDFNCVLSNSDCTGHSTSSRALERLIHSFRLNSGWDVAVNPQAFTHYTPTGAACLDRIHVTEELRRNKQGVVIITAAFTDHLAVLLKVNLSKPIIHRWRMNTSFLNDTSFRLRIKDTWTEWTKHIRRYVDIVQWWVYYVKRRIESLFIREGAERNSNRIKMEGFYYRTLYDVLQEPGQHEAKMIKLKKLKTNIIRLNSSYRQRLLIKHLNRTG